MIWKLFAYMWNHPGLHAHKTVTRSGRGLADEFLGTWALFRVLRKGPESFWWSVRVKTDWVINIVRGIVLQGLIKFLSEAQAIGERRRWDMNMESY